MKISARSVDLEKDWPLLSGWWVARGQQGPAWEMLPATGIVLEADGAAVACGWAYLDKTARVAFPCWFATRPGLTPFQSQRFLTEVMSALECVLSELGAVFAFAFSGNRGVQAILGRRGYMKAHAGVEYWCVLNAGKEASCQQP